MGQLLADGLYFGYLERADPRARTLTFDVAQWFSGDEAVRAAREDGGESPPPNDYWIRNRTRATRVLDVDLRAQHCVARSHLDDPEDPTHQVAVDLATLASVLARPDAGPIPFWVTVRSRTVVHTEEPFLP